MASNTEHTEAKLAAYVDGTLDPAERAQIEQYLAANPEHRRLIEELTAQRDVLRALPRERAPADVYDSIQAQLERSILLDDTGQASAPSLHHRRRPPMLALAAMVLLTFGLGAVLYFALPTSRPGGTEVAVVHPGDRVAPASPEVASREMERTNLPVETGAPTTALADGIASAEGGQTLSGSGTGSVGLQPEIRSNAVPPSPTRDVITMSKGGVPAKMATIGKLEVAAATDAAKPEQLVVLVSTDNPDHVHRQVTLYLESNNIRWETTPDAGTGAGGADQFVLRARRTAGYHTAPVAGGEPIRSKGGGQTPEASVTGTGVAAVEPATQESVRQQVAVGGVGEQLLAEGKDAAEGEGQSKFFQRDVDAAKQGDRVAGGLLTAQQVQQPGDPEYQQQQLAQVQQQQEMKQMPAPQQLARVAPSGEVTRSSRIIARGMTRRQAVELASSLSAERVGQTARLVAEEPIFAGRELNVEGPSLTLVPNTAAAVAGTEGEDRREASAGAAATTQVTQQAATTWQSAQQPVEERVVGTVPAATSDQAQSAVPQRTDVGEGSVPTAHFRQQAAGVATTVPVAGRAVGTAGDPAASQPVAAEDEGGDATTRPVADQPVDVVILVQDEVVPPSKIAPSFELATPSVPAPTSQPGSE